MSRILLIDDDDILRETLRDALIHAGYEITEAKDGEEGVNAYRQDPHDLVLTDLFMPKKDGIDMIFELTQQFPDVKIIAISGGGQWGSLIFLEHVKLFGAIKTFTKPVNLKELILAIEDTLSR